MPKIDPKKNDMIPVFPEGSPMKIKYKDIFDLKLFYKALHEWLLEHEWGDVDGDADHWESYYGEKVDQGGAKELWFYWRMKKAAPDKKELVYHLDMNFHCLGLVTKEIIKDGKKMKANKGEVEMFIIPWIQPLYEKKFREHPILGSLLNLFKKRIYDENIEIAKKEFYQEAYTLNNFIKQWFKLKRYLPYEETKDFFASKAWPSHLKS